MKILCQERYEKAVAYAKEIKNDTLQKCIDRLKQWEENPNGHCRRFALSRTARPIVCCIAESYSRVEYTYLGCCTPINEKANLGLSGTGLSWLFLCHLWDWKNYPPILVRVIYIFGIFF